MEPKKEPSTTLIYVSNLPFTTTDEQFRDIFKDLNVKTAYVARRKNGRSKGFGFVNLENGNDQKAAIERASNTELENRKLIAKVAFNDERRNEKGELREEFKTQTQTQSTPSETVAHVSNLAWTVNDEELRKLFNDFTPKSATVATRRNGRSKGFGFVEFNNKEELERALKLNGTSVSGRNILVQASVRRPSQPRQRNNQNNRPRNNNNQNSRPRNFRNNNNNNNSRNNNNNNSNNTRDFRVVRRTERSENTLYISNLPFELDDNDLRQIFQEFNPKNAKIPVRRGGKSKGYGFVEFNNANDQNEALKALDQSEVNGRLITIKVSQPTQRNNQNSRPRNNNNFRPRNNNNNYRNNNNNIRGGNRNNNNQNNRPRNNNNQNRPRNTDQNREVSSNMVYVSNLPFSIDDNALAGIFQGQTVSKAYVSRKRNGYSRGYGFVEFSSNEEQQKALGKNGADVSGRPIVVQAAFKVENKTN